MEGNKTPQASKTKGLTLLMLLLAYVVLYFFRADLGLQSARVAGEYFLELLWVIPPVFVLMGLFQQWVSKDMIQKYLGRDAGIRGLVLAYVMGTLPTGPVYVAFPVAAALMTKGARLRNVIVFLGVWAAAKLPQVLMEIKFLGVAFALTRHVLTVAVIVGIAWFMERRMDAAQVRARAREALTGSGGGGGVHGGSA